ncbi:beta-lactamase/transpeptidase-like protein [Podospora fimiseda]|uniref:Beta-lactamase/transpeptidase-like protein n=1 Tax=Podospora fimiseda TaxID=252190 RepID=A0AAN7BXX9_9PEZI|nr:beta-lactamase/transpeptidase-like protein [Podospora fimiseda]
MQIASMTKQVVAVAALQLIEQDKLSLEDLVEDYLPSWKNISVLQGFDSVCGEPILRQPKTKATILNLFTHTSGLAYWFLTDSINTWRLWSEKQQVKPDEPLAADPGTGYFYGESIDTLGYVIEAISGQGLDEYIQANIFRPLGIKNSGLITPDIWTHYRYPNGTIVLTSPPTPIGPEGVAFGGGYLISTLDDYSTFLLTLLNWGTHPLSGVTLLKSSTVRRIVFADLIPKAITVPDSERTGEPVGAWKSNNQSYSLSLDFLPGIKKGWSGSLLINLEDVEGRRRKGSGAWAGIFNTFYWVDLWSGKLGVIFTNLMPFLDGEVLGLFDRLEEFVYSG